MSRSVILVGLTVPMSLSLLGNRLSMMIDRGWEVHVAIGESMPAHARMDPRVAVHHIPMTREISPVSDLRSLSDWYTLIGHLKPTHVIGATPKAGFLSMLAARRRRVPNRLFEAWGARWDGVYGIRGAMLRAADRATVASATQTVAVSDSLADLFVSRGIAKFRPTVLGHGATQGVDLSRFFPAPERLRVGLPGMVGFLGRLAADKGIADLTTVMECVRTLKPDTELQIAGEIDSADPVNVHTQAWLAASPYNTLLGQTDEVPAFLRELDVLCFPSHREGLPNALIEAAACGVPAVAWDVTGTRDAIIDGETGFLIPLGDHEAMADRIIQILADSLLADRLGSAAREMARERFDSRLVQSAFVDFIADL